MKSLILSTAETVARFTHIDATFVSCDCLPGSALGRYVVSYYPWYEHPRYRQAIEMNRTWGFSDVGDAAKPVVVLAHNVLSVRLSLRRDVTDWDFPETHPELWSYEPEAEIFINSEYDRKELFARLCAAEIPYADTAYLRGAAGLDSEFKAPFSLGHFPKTVFEVITKGLREMGVAVHLPRVPVSTEVLPQMLLIDGEDYVIAERIEVEVPHFEHKDEWWAPG